MTDTNQGRTAADPHREVVLVIGLHLRPGAREEFMALLAPVLDAMRHEPTFVNTVLHEDPEDPDRLMLYETWADFTDLVEVQVNRPYRQAYTARLDELLAEPRSVAIWRRLRSDFAFRF
jgi:quinol monooxygenase YgiN